MKNDTIRTFCVLFQQVSLVGLILLASFPGQGTRQLAAMR